LPGQRPRCLNSSFRRCRGNGGGEGEGDGGERYARPFLDPDVVAFLMGIPDEQLLDHSFHTEAVAATYPRWSGLPYVQREADRHDASHYRRL